MRRDRLIPHPSRPAPALRLFAETARIGAGGLVLRFRAAGETEGIALAGDEPPRRRDGLWRTTCFECFLAERDGPRYAEFNFAPSGSWAAYLFDAERRGMRDAPVAPPRLAFAAAPGGLSLTARIGFAGLPFAPARLGVAAVIEWSAGATVYYALAHAGAAPDFHAPAGFIIDLSAFGGANGDAQ